MDIISQLQEPPANPTEDLVNFLDQPKLMSAALVKAAKQFDALVAALPSREGDEEAQLRRIVELQAENNAVNQELQKQLEAAGTFSYHFGCLLANDCDPQFMRSSRPRLKPMKNPLILQGLELIRPLKLVPVRQVPVT